jgi:hypothetical protein
VKGRRSARETRVSEGERGGGREEQGRGRMQAKEEIYARTDGKEEGKRYARRAGEKKRYTQRARECHGHRGYNV